MRKMKDSGVEWIGKIPEDWEVSKNKYIFNRKKELVGHDWDKTQLLSLTTKGIVKKDINNLEGKLPDSFSTYQIIKTKDLVLCLFDLDISAVFNGLSDFDGMISPAYKRYGLNVEGDIRYFNYFFDFVFEGRKYKNYSTTLRFTLDNSEFDRIKTIIPNVKEQKRIADFLDGMIGQISYVSSRIIQEIQTLETYKKSVITEAVTKGLDKNAEMKDSGIEWIGEIPKHWKLKRIRNITTKSERGTSPTYTTDETLSKVVNQATFSSGYFDKSNIRFSSIPAKESKGLLEKGDVLIASTGGGILGKTHYFMEDEEYVADGHVTVMRTNPSIQNSKLLFYIFSINYDLINGVLAKGSTNQTELQSVWLNNFKIPCPDVTEQEEIVSYLDKKTQVIDEVITIKQNQLSLLDEYKKSLIYEYVTGKREV